MRIEHRPIGDPCEHCGQPAAAHRVRTLHIPQGDPCRKCGLPASAHSAHPEHEALGDPCTICGMPKIMHRVRSRERTVKPVRQKAARGPGAPKRVKPDMSLPFIGLDGEGVGRGPHKYIMLRAADETGRGWHLTNPDGLRTEECLDFILSLPLDRFVFGYALNYDWTKILADLPDELLYLLFRPDERPPPKDRLSQGPAPITWKDYRLNSQGSKLVIARGHKERVVWDIFKFFQGKFVSALKDWKIGDAELYARMGGMKDARSEFSVEDLDAIGEYCHEECVCMAKLARALVNAHVEAGLELTSFYGAGSSASAMLKKMSIKEQISEPPEQMMEAVASAFVGGRFENSVIGIVPFLENADISSAYPYQLYKLPCILHAKWIHTKRRAALDGARQALVHFRVHNSPIIEHWAPFPHRDENGGICFPRVHPGGWVWIDEYLSGERIWPNNVEFVEAYILEQTCDCHPFKDIPFYYLERLRIGKEGAGIVFKLAPNSCYGKIAQSIGNGAFTSWVWAGMITSGTRGQLLDNMGAHSALANVHMVATDGVFGGERIVTPTPIDTGTSDYRDSKGNAKPLGGWEQKRLNQPCFIARPGIYFPINPTADQLKECKGRGLGKNVVYDNWEAIVNSWNTYGTTRKVPVANVSRFCGAVTSIHRVPAGKGKFRYVRANGHNGRPDQDQKEWPSYGEWVTRTVELDFKPLPKRERVMADGKSLELREVTRPTTPYSKILLESPHPLGLGAMELIEQPEGDYYL